MISPETIAKILASRKSLIPEGDGHLTPRKAEAEGGCGVIGIASSERIPGRHLFQALEQMRNRGNGKGGGIAAVGLVPEDLGVTREILENDYLLAIAYLEASARPEVERSCIEPTFEIHHAQALPSTHDSRILARLDVKPPEVFLYFGRVRPEAIEGFKQRNGLEAAVAPPTSPQSIEDEIVYQNSYRLNRAFYASTGEKRAFVLSHGKNMLVLKMVGYGDDVIRYYQLENTRAHVWLGHHRYPTKGKVWHPGGAHPFVGLHEALVHNGDFANYASICEYLAQRNIYPLFLTDTEVSVLLFDLFHRTYAYPLEYVIESLAPTTERDFALLPEERQSIYQQLQTVHIHGSPDGPWFFLIAQSSPAQGEYRLIGITDTSMLRPQVFALQEGPVSVGFAASEKQAIDAALESLAREDPRFWSHADRYWNARGGSHTDGGAFIFTVHADGNDHAKLQCTDKFGRAVRSGAVQKPYDGRATAVRTDMALPDVPVDELFGWVKEQLPGWDYGNLLAFLKALERAADNGEDRRRALEAVTLLMDRRYPTGAMRRSSLLSLFDQSLGAIVESVRRSPSEAYVFVDDCSSMPSPSGQAQTVVLDARGFAAEGERSLARKIVWLYQRGFRNFMLAHVKGHRFIANGLGAGTQGVHIDVYGASGDYLASGIDGADVVVHGDAQDQLAQIMKDGTLVVYGSVGQTFLYAGKGGYAFVLGNAAGRPLINAVGKPRVVINGTCLDYLAESFMAGDPLDGGGFVVLNGIALSDQGEVVELDTPYPGGNLFSLASGGAIYIRDPHGKVSEEQLNGGEFSPLEEPDWAVIHPFLEENARLFGIPVAWLLEVDGKPSLPAQVYRKIHPRAIGALQPEEAWVKMHV
ncbi:MAG: glutamate synthase [Terriglobia bacterium]|jgi:glutamate synthase domain-containing protein 1/glutamate synthase domain-containing protein 3